MAAIPEGGAAIRPALPSDAGEIASLIERYWAFESIPDFDRRRIEGLMAGLIGEPARGRCWVADAGGILQGYLVAVFMLSLEHGGIMAEVDELYVVEQQRSKGLGARLLAVAERDMAAAGLVRLQLQVAADNDPARGFYERRGFVDRARYSFMDKPLGARTCEQPGHKKRRHG